MDALNIALALVLMATQTGGAASPETPTYVITAMVVAAESGDPPGVTITTDRGETVHLTDPAHANVQSSRVVAVDVGELRIDLAGAIPTFDGEPEPPPGCGAEILSAPRVNVPAGEKATVRSGAAVQYFETEDGRCYRLRTLPQDQSPELRLDLTARPAERPDLVDLDLTLRLATVSGREPLPGVELEVGKPVLVSRELATRIRLDHGRWSLVAGHALQPDDSGTPRVLLLLLRVDPLG